MDVVWLLGGLLSAVHGIRGLIRGKFKNRGRRWVTRGNSPFLFWLEVVFSLAIGVALAVVGLTTLWSS